jgi:hypothetical protein
MSDQGFMKYVTLVIRIHEISVTLVIIKKKDQFH